MANKDNLAASIQIPDQDLEERRINQRVDPITNTVYTRRQYNCYNRLDDYKENDDDSEEKEMEDEQQSKEDDLIFADDLVRW